MATKSKAHAPAKAPRRSRITALEADEFFKQFEASPAVISREDFNDIERAITKGSDVTTRRVGLGMLMLSGRELVKAVAERDSAVAVATAAECARHAAGRLRELAKMLDTAEIRMTLALCNRPDMTELIAEEKADFAEGGRS